MATITRIPRKYKEFSYDGIKFALRPTTTREQEDITRRMSEYQRSLRDEIKRDVADGIFEQNTQQGDLAVLVGIQNYVAQMLVVDYETHQNLFVGEHAVENIGDVPAEFVTESWKCYTGQNGRTFKATSLIDIFGEQFVRDYAIVPSDVLELELNRLDIEDPKKAHEARVSLDLVKPGESNAKNPPSKDATTTSDSGDKSFESQSISPSTQS
ncbi:MAG: hypothetical protein NVSMB14_06990 [Isosphaeraceae bacterium]